jgi:N-acetylglucosamine-6-phosphate deacetylase
LTFKRDEVLTMQIKNFSSNKILNANGKFVEANLEIKDTHWSNFSVGELSQTHHVENYLVPTLPVEIHIHGLSDFDFSNDNFFDLEEVDRHSRNEGIICVPSIFLAQYNLNNFVEFTKKFKALKDQGKLNNIPVISLEGPMLGSFGGTPQKGTWLPSVDEWNKIISCAEFGLKYIVLSPDALSKGSCLYSENDEEYPSLEWILNNIFKSGIKVSIGHFHKKNSEESSRLINVVVDIAKKYYPSNSDSAVIVDHFFNDMPSNIKYAWRTPESKLTRDEDIKNLKVDEWSLDNIEEVLGIVPSTIIKAARKGDLTVCLNFDGEHVDPIIAQKVVELIGTQNVCAMTDRLEVNRMGNISLSQKEHSSLWYQESGVVAAGTSTIDQQMEKLRMFGFNESEIWTMCSFTPYKIVGIDQIISINHDSVYSLVTKERKRYSFEARNELATKF